MSRGGIVSRLLGRGHGEGPPLESRMAAFREVLHANNSALGHVERIQEALDSGRLSAAELRRLVAGVMVQTYRMVVHLNRMTEDRYGDLVPLFESLKSGIARGVEITPSLREVGMVLGLADVDASLSEVVGQKSAFLGEARRVLGGRVPDGFATTVAAYRALMEEGGLGDRIAAGMEGADPGDVASCFRASAGITGAILASPLPAAVAAALRAGAASFSPGDRLAVRSSALQEGGMEVSFAGQYRSLLNVPPAALEEAFRQVVAGKYSPQAIAYRLGRGFEDDEVAMCCCVVRMVEARAAGVLYGACATSLGQRTLIQAVRGLGLSAVDGSAEPDSCYVDRERREVASYRTGVQAGILRSAAAGGVERVDLDASLSGRAILSPGLALEIADAAWRLEDRFGMPLDMEWAVDGDGRVHVLQVRPQPRHAEQADRPTGARVPGAAVLLEGGSRASRGAGSGPLRRVGSDADVLGCAPGSVIAVAEADPRFAVLLPGAAALVADRGEVTGHLATVARELRVPALLATRTATAVLPPDGEVVTVDADAGVVYRGRVEAVLAGAAERPAGPRNPNVERLASVKDLIVPLTLRDRQASGYSPGECRTIHDIIRFCHQATVEEMFELGDGAVNGGTPARRLVSSVPIDCRVFDLGGGLAPGAPGGDVTMDQVACAPMRALWRGMTDPRLRWRTLRPVSLRGFMSAVVNYNFDQDQRLRPMGEPSYAFISSDSMSLNSRIGYHFSTVDARVCDRVESNHASFRFVGGATGVEQRSRRAVLIRRLLSARGFECDQAADLVNARVRHLPPEAMEEALATVGLVMGYVNHLDMSLTSDATVKEYEDAFNAGDYAFRRDHEG